MRLLLVLVLVAGSPQDEKKGPRNKEVRKAYAALMADNGKENEAIKKDLDDKKGDADIKARLAKLRKNVEAASKLDYLKGPKRRSRSSRRCSASSSTSA
jgi:hypothetical protein